MAVNGLGAFRRRALSSLNGTQAPPPSPARSAVGAWQPVVMASTAPATEPASRTPPQVVQAYACLIGGTTAMAVAFAAGAENLVNTIAGGIVPTQNQGVLILGVAGIVFASFCAIGEALTPVYLYYAEPPATERTADAPRMPRSRPAAHAVAPTRVNFQSGVLGSRAFGAAPGTGDMPAIGVPPVADGLARAQRSRER